MDSAHLASRMGAQIQDFDAAQRVPTRKLVRLLQRGEDFAVAAAAVTPPNPGEKTGTSGLDWIRVESSPMQMGLRSTVRYLLTMEVHVYAFAIAALMHAALTLGWPPTVRAAATIGFIGGLTTYSSYNYETTRLFEEGASAASLANLGLTVIVGLMAGWLGIVAAREVLGR